MNVYNFKLNCIYDTKYGPCKVVGLDRANSFVLAIFQKPSFIGSKLERCDRIASKINKINWLGCKRYTLSESFNDLTYFQFDVYFVHKDVVDFEFFHRNEDEFIMY